MNVVLKLKKKQTSHEAAAPLETGAPPTLGAAFAAGAGTAGTAGTVGTLALER